MPARALFNSGTVLMVAAALSAFGFIQACSRSPAETTRAGAAVVPRETRLPVPLPDLPRPDPKNLPTLSAHLPVDVAVDVATGSAPRHLQERADTFSWNTFLALNWPAAADGSTIPSRYPGQQGDNSTVWESWPEAGEIFLPGGRDPASWDFRFPKDTSAPDAAALPERPRILSRVGKDLAGLAPDSHLGPLIDQNGRYVRLEIRVNRPVFDTLVAQRQSAAALDASLAFAPGSIRVQAAWKILSAAEVAAGRFHTAEALLPPADTSEGPSASPSFERVVVGLVGLHIARKTPAFPGWIWSTFEHVDNCPTLGEPADRAAYNFYDKASPGRPANQPPPPPWDPAAVEPPSRRSQIVRQTPIPFATRAVSAAYQAALRAINPASVWQYYQLVGTQTGSLADDGSASAPRELGNTTLEPYLATSASPTASCIDCHAKAATADGAFADTSFLLRLAR